MASELKFEVCVDSLDSALEAVKGGAISIELCSSLFMDGGLTPSYGVMSTILSTPPFIHPTKRSNNNEKYVQVHVMIRPRAGDFLYSQSEINAMLADIRIAKQLGAYGIVVGCLTEEGDVNSDLLKQFIEAAHPLSVTFHRAFDMSRDLFHSLKKLCETQGISRILTSGGEPSALDGSENLERLHHELQATAQQLQIVCAGGLSTSNIKLFRKIVPSASFFHLSARIQQESAMKYRNSRVFMGGTLRQDEYSTNIASSSKLQSFIKVAESQ